MKFTIAAVGDTHAAEDIRFAEHNRVMRWIADDARARGVAGVVHTGDVWERKSTSVERAAVGEWVRAITDFAPLAVVAGNHDDPLDIVWLSRLATKNSVVAFDRPGAIEFAGVKLAALPWPRKAAILAANPEASKEESSQNASHLLRVILAGLADTLDAFEGNGPRVLLSHAMIDGARTDHDQPLVGCDMSLALADLALARADVSVIGHIHAQNDWTFGGAPMIYTGAPRHTNFGEPGPKGYVLLHFEDDRFIGWERIATPTTPMVLLEQTWGPVDESDDGQPIYGMAENDTTPPYEACGGAEVRLRYQVDADRRDAAKRGAAEYRTALIAKGAKSVQVEEIVRASVRARVPEIVIAKTMAGKLVATWDASSSPPPADRRTSILEKLQQVEEEVRHAA